MPLEVKHLSHTYAKGEPEETCIKTDTPSGEPYVNRDTVSCSLQSPQTVF